MNSHDGTVSVNIGNNLVDEIKEKLEALQRDPMNAEKFTMFRVPKHIRDKYKELYVPRMVSIGPYFNGIDALKAMEKHKLRYLQDYLSRNTRNSLEHCISELMGLESLTRKCYFEEVELESKEFVMMMLLDGCFIIEFLIRWYSGPRDPIFDVDWTLPSIRSDLLLLENQIPFFVIKKLFDLLTCYDPVPVKENASVGTPADKKIASLVEMLLEYLSEQQGAARPILTHVEIKHILHLYHLCYVPSPRPKEISARTSDILRWLNPIKLLFVFLACILKRCFRRTKSTNGRSAKTIPSATALIEAGVIFKCRNSENILDIKFQNGTLEIPFFSIEETRRSRLLNLVCFEQHDNKLQKNLTSYMSFMGGLFKTAKDVTLLQKKGIVENLLATDEELVSFFNWITECAFLEYEADYLKNQVENVNKYYMTDWHRWKAKLKRDYFSNPWLIISFAAAFILLALTVVQTLFSILSYF